MTRDKNKNTKKQTIKHPPPKKKTQNKTKQSTHNQLKKVENRSTESFV